MPRGWIAGLALAGAVMVVAAGCGLARTVEGGMSSGCGGMPGGACEEQVALISARHPGATHIDIVCTSPVCDRSHGSGTARVTQADGSQVNDTFTYTGNGAPMPQPVCRGLAPALCRSLATGQFDQLPTQRRAVRIEVTCTSASCTDNAGDADVRILLDDGTTREGGVGWQGGPP